MGSQSSPLGSHNFDPRICGVVVRIGAIAALALVLCAVIMLAMIDPSNTRCPGWHISGSAGRSPTSIWLFVAMAAFAACGLCYQAIRWSRVAQLMVNRIEQGETSAGPLAHYVRSINFNLIFVIVMIGFVIFAAIPLVIVAAKCA